jgi:hypothetical protein
MASVRFADLQSRPTESLDFTSLTLDTFQHLPDLCAQGRGLGSGAEALSSALLPGGDARSHGSGEDGPLPARRAPCPSIRRCPQGVPGWVPEARIDGGPGGGAIFLSHGVLRQSMTNISSVLKRSDNSLGPVGVTRIMS